MSTHDVDFYEDIAKIPLNYRQMITLSTPTASDLQSYHCHMREHLSSEFSNRSDSNRAV